MKISRIKSHILRCPMDEELGYSQAFFTHRSAYLVEVETDEGLVGWGECFGAGNVALGNRAIVEQVIAPMILGDDPLDRSDFFLSDGTCREIGAVMVFMAVRSVTAVAP